MVGDSLPHDIEGARRVGMRGILVQRSPDGAVRPRGRAGDSRPVGAVGAS